MQKKIKVEKPTAANLKELGVESWPEWECPPSTFDWEYTSDEVAYILEGHARVTYADEEVHFKEGDLVHFPKGLKCKWEVLRKIRKVYTFK